MTDELTVRIGYRVSTEEQALHAEALIALDADLLALVGRLRRIDRMSTPLHAVLSGAPVLALGAEAAIDIARASLMLAVGRARLAVTALTVTAAGYAAAERQLHALARTLGSVLGYGLGLLGPFAVPWLLSPLLTALTGLGVVSWLPGGERMLRAGVSAWWAEHRGILSDPLTVELVRAAMMGADDVVGGALRLPPSLVLLLGDRGLGITGVSTTAGLLVALANGAGALREAPVITTRTGSAPATAPAGLRDRLARVPHGGAHQIRVERYPNARGADRVEVFIGGTVDGSLIAGEQPWDMTSNAHATAALEPASLRAVHQAMADAGVTPTDRVAITGYSQGALVGALIAASGDYSVDFLLEVGGPSGQVPVPDTVTHVRIDHSSDLVTALGGDVRGEHTVQIRRDGVPQGGPGGGPALPAHDLDFYLETATLADQSRHPEIRRAITAADAPLADTAPGEAIQWRARRRGQRRSRVIGRTIRPINQLMSASTRAPSTPHQKPSTTSPKPMRSEIHATMSSSNAFTTSEMRPSVRM